MPTYDQLDDEAAWRAETAAPALQTLGDRLRLHWPGAEIGIRGDNNHLRGYHRSRRWIKESGFCTNRSYSVSRAAGDRSGGDSNWACALDFGGIPQSELHAVCRRLDTAVRAGLLEKITEWYGNFGGDDRVDGWDNISNRIASSDSSHLTHLHMSFDRGRANEDHSDVLAVLIGEDDVSDAYELLVNARRPGVPPGSQTHSEPRYGSVSNAEVVAIIQRAHHDARHAADRADEIAAKLDALTTPGPVDIAALAAALRPELDAAAERAVRKVLGSLDEQLPIP
ncbi:MAG TPA: hypothetical protein VFC19_22300 [Candidatus Limnocylindrales bacterium]|nr:hypothetical protein [Candidatus Limnocylindrales bacterium]